MFILYKADTTLKRTADTNSLPQTHKIVNKADTNKKHLIGNIDVKMNLADKSYNTTYCIFITMSCLMSLAPFVLEIFALCSWRQFFCKILIHFQPFVESQSKTLLSPSSRYSGGILNP